MIGFEPQSSGFGSDKSARGGSFCKYDGQYT